MWPWGHLAVGYLVYSAYTRVRYGQPPSVLPVVILAVATQLPDLIDKPLAWTLAVLPNGRSLGHSLVIALPLLAVIWYTVPKKRSRLIAPLGVGYLSHVLTDALHPVLRGELHYVGFLGWPIVPPIEYPTDQSFLAHLTAIDVTPWMAVQLILVAAAVITWFRDGTPGFDILKSTVRTRTARLTDSRSD